MIHTTYVTFSDKPLQATEDTLALAGETDSDTDLKTLLILMYKQWIDHLKLKETVAGDSRVVGADGRPIILG